MTPGAPLAVVTGGAGDLGGEIARSLIDSGHRVALFDRTESIAVAAAREIADEAICRGFGANQQHVGEVRAAFAAARDWAGAPRVTVANAGYAKFSPMIEMDPAVWDRHIAVNLSGTFYVCQASAQLMAESGEGGSIIVISSSLATAHSDQVGAYCVSKAALLPMVTSFAAELGIYGIRVNAILPGVVETGMTHAMLDEHGARDALLNDTPLGRLGRGADIAAAVDFLASDSSAWVTGTHLAVDGGQSIYNQPQWIKQRRNTPGDPSWGPGLAT